MKQYRTLLSPLFINVPRLLAVVMLLSTLALAPAGSAAELTLVWNGDADKAVALKVEGAVNLTRLDATGAKITSNDNSANFPGVYFIFESKQKDKGYLKVHAEVFRKYVSFVMTT